MMKLIKKKALILLSCLVASFNLYAQDYSSTSTGAWNSNLLVWGLITGVPGAADDVLINNPHIVTIANNESCNNLSIEGTLTIDGGDLTINSDLELETGGTIDIQDGITVINGNFNCNGMLNITSSPTNYVELKGELQKDGETKWMVIDGSVRIYGDIEVYINEI